MKILRIKDKEVLLDDDTYEQIASVKWYIETTGYVCRKTALNGKLFMHHLILPLLPNKEIDHINRNPLDNRRINLRLVTHSENQHNHNLHKNNTSGYNGVSLNARTGKWHAQLKHQGKRFHIGFYDDFYDAVKARIKKEVELGIIK